MHTPNLFRVLFISVLFLTPAVVFCQPTVSIQDAVVTEPPPGMDMTAGYCRLRNSGDQPISLLQVTSPDFGKIEMHRTTITNGIAGMTRQKSITIPARSNFSFKPGTYHLMMFHPQRQLAVGDSVSLRFHFSDASSVKVTAAVVTQGMVVEQYTHSQQQ